MKLFFAACAVLMSFQLLTVNTPLSMVPPAQAQELSASLQHKLKKLTQTINKARSSLASQSDVLATDEFKKKQFGQRIESYANGLKKYPANSDPVFQAAMAELQALQTEFDALKSGATQTQAPTAPQSPTTPSAPSTTASNTAPTQPESTPAPASSDVRPLVSGERVRVKKLVRDMTNVLGSITTEGPSLYQDPLEYNAAVKRFTQFTDAINKYPQANDPDVIAARKTYLQLRASLKAELDRGKQQWEVLGDVMANLRALQNRDNEIRIPDALVPPFSKADVEPWLADSLAARDTAKKDYEYIQAIAPIAYLPEFTKSGRKAEFGSNDLPRLLALTENRYKRANSGYLVIKQNISSALQQLDQQIQQPDARTSNADLARHRKAFDDMIPVAESLVNLESVLGKPTTEAKAAVAAIHERRATYEAQREASIDQVRMPAALSTDPERLAIAKDILERPKYKYGEHGAIILNTAKILEKERTHDEIEIDDVDFYGGEIRMSGTKETTVWKWKEFQFATALKEDDGHWRIYYIKPKLFTSGASTTPLNTWIAGGTIEGELIREEHIGQ